MRTTAPWLCLALAACRTSSTPDEEEMARYDAANGLFDEGRYSEAIPEYQWVISHRSGLKDAYVRLAYCQEMLGDESRAIEALERLLRVDRDDEYALRHLWRLYIHRGFVEKALGVCQRLQRLYPSDVLLRTEIARLEGLKKRP